MLQKRPFLMQAVVFALPRQRQPSDPTAGYRPNHHR